MPLRCLYIARSVIVLVTISAYGDIQPNESQMVNVLANISAANHTKQLRARARNVWEWRTDMPIGVQITYDLTGNMQHSLYGACWPDPIAQTVGEQAVQSNIEFVRYHGETGVTLFNRRLSPQRRGCLMRKSRVPIDLSKIGRIEMDVKASGPGSDAPWYAVWLAPMMYSVPGASDKAAEIDLIENYDHTRRGYDVNQVKTVFALCDPKLPGQHWTAPFCKPLKWGVEATTVDHHITLSAWNDAREGRVIEIKHCVKTKAPIQTCTASEAAFIKVTKANPGVPDWFPIWNKTIAGSRYGHYWLVTDLWWTSNTAMFLRTDNLRFFNDDGSEWKMPL